MSVANANFVAASELTAGVADVSYKTFNEIPPDGYQVSTLDRNVPSSNTAPLATGRESAFLLYIPAGLKFTKIFFWAGTTAAGTPTNQWFTLRTLSRQLIGITQDDTTAVWASNTEKQLSFANVTTGALQTITAPYSGYYYIGVNVTATTPPSLQGIAIGLTAIATKPPIAAGFDAAAGLTTPATALATLNALTSNANLAYCGLI
jgi:hypothetical protein